ncbi:MAG: KpsF/GutQ family sugar-phosphate isomerase [Planctomycetota bacterium]
MSAKSEIQNPKSDNYAAFAREVLDAEADAIRRIQVGPSFPAAVQLVVDATRDGDGSLVVTGLGKSGLIGQKLSATFASTGTPSHFLHPVEAMHGDLGRVRRGDAVLLLSFGGNTEELVTLAELLKQDGVPMIALTKNDGPGNGLSRHATVTLPVGDITEACPHELAPTSSTTAMLALGDALALAVSWARRFTADDFQKFHPGGGLGRQLTPVVDAMRFTAPAPGSEGNKPGNLSLIPLGTVVHDAYAAAERHAQDSGLRRPGALLVVHPDGTLAGIVTDGDLRTALIRNGPQVWSEPIDQIMTAKPTTLPDSALVRDAVHIVREKRFDEIPVVASDGKPVGLIDVQDLAALKVIEG